MKEIYEQYKDLIIKIVSLVLVVLGIYLFFNTIFQYVAPFVFGYLLSLILNPLANLLVKKLKLSRGLAAISSIVIMFLSVGLIFRGIIARIIYEGAEFIRGLPEVVVTVQEALNGLTVRYHNLYNLIPIEFQETFQSMGESVLNSVTSLVGSGIRTGSTSIVSVVPGFILGTLLCILSCYFFIKDKKIIGQYISDSIPKSLKDRFRVIKVSVYGALNGYLKAQLIIMSIIATICVIGLLILRIPYALFLAIIIAFVDALPVFGSGFFYWPWIAFSLITGEYSRAMGLGIIYVVVLLTRQLLEPKIVGHHIGIHPLVTLMAIYVGLRVFGVLGIFMGPCVVVIIKGIVDAPVAEN